MKCKYTWLSHCWANELSKPSQGSDSLSLTENWSDKVGPDFWAFLNTTNKFQPTIVILFIIVTELCTLLSLRVLFSRLEKGFKHPVIDVAILESLQKLGYDHPTQNQVHLASRFVPKITVFFYEATKWKQQVVSLCFSSVDFRQFMTVCWREGYSLMCCCCCCCCCC